MANTERIDKRIQELEEKLKQERALLERLKARKQQADRKADTRRKILAGAVILRKAQQDPEFAVLLNRWLGEALSAPRDRDLFDLAAPSPPANDDQTLKATGEESI